MDMRELKGLEIAARMRVVFEGDAWIVPSQAGNGKYKVALNPDGDNCTCDDFQLHRKSCKHIYAARFTRERSRGEKVAEVDTDTVPIKKTYRQNWAKYNEAQINEKHRFQVLLHDLCSGLEELPSKGGLKGGRPRCPIADCVFGMVFKVYSTFSSRRFGCDLADAVTKGYLSRPMHPNRVNCFLEMPEMTDVLKRLIVVTSQPLKAIETEFTVDSSGFSTSRFERWFDYKYGTTRCEHTWVKAHLACGVKTNVVTAVEILDKNAGDSPQFKPLMEKTAETFKVGEVSADKAYSSVENVELVEKLGGTAFIAFKNNATGGAGGLWERMFHYFQFRRDEFLAHYHKRSNAESTFSMIKAKFRDHVRSRSDAAMVNEVLCKLVAHNICVLILAQCELGISAVFWDEGAAAETKGPDVLPMMPPVA